MKQTHFDFYPAEEIERRKKIEKEFRKRWRESLQKYCDKKSQEEGPYTGYCVCGYMNYCDLCKGSGETNACVKAILELCRNKNIQIDYSNFNFKQFLEEIKR